MEIDKHLGRRIVEARLALQLDRAEVASAIGVTLEDYKAIETGAMRIQAVYMARLSKELGQPLKWFFDGLPGQDTLNSIRVAR